MIKTLACVLAIWCAQAKPELEVEKTDAPPPQLNDLMEASKQLGEGQWDGHAQLEMRAMERVFDRQGWKSEEDRFAMQVVQRVNAIPPWNQADRQNAFLDALTERYKFNSDQRRQINRIMQRETMRFTINHFKDIAPIALDAIKTRASGQPYSAEQIAEWSKTLSPLAEQAREAFERSVRELSKDMTEEQKAVLKRDVSAVLRRHKAFASQMKDWEKGEWKPEDWGLDGDPIQSGAKENASSAKVASDASELDLARAREAAIKSAAEGNRSDGGRMGNINADGRLLQENEWERYVREFCDRHACTDPQRKSAQGVLRELLTRARDWRAANGQRIEEARAKLGKAQSADQQKPLREQLETMEKPLSNMFEELKRRLDALLTAEQRKATAAKP